MILDSNILIYSIKPEFEYVREYIANDNFSVSAVTYLEVMGYHNLTYLERTLFKRLIDTYNYFSISDEIIYKAVEIRQIKSVSLADSIIAATAILKNLTLVTHNTKDFDWIENLNLIDIIES